MDSDGFAINNEKYLEPEVWDAQRREKVEIQDSLEKRPLCDPDDVRRNLDSAAQIERAARGITSADHLTLPTESVLAPRSSMTVAQFVEHKFVPEHLARKGIACRIYYQAMLKHVLTPEEVDRVFQVKPANSRRRLRTIPDWPYLSSVRLCDALPEHVDRLISAALRRGYSAQTVTHIRNVVSVIFSYARQERCFTGENPARQVKLSGSPRKDEPVLTLDQANAALKVMNYPEKEITIMAILTGMNISEIRGLQWKYVNLTEQELASDGKLIPPRTIAVRRMWYRNELGEVKKSRVRNVPISQPLLQLLVRLGQRPRFTEPDSFVFASRTGGTVNVDNIMVRKLRPMAEHLGVPSLSWRVFFRTRKSLVSELGGQFQDSMVMITPSAPLQNAGTEHKLRCRVVTRQRS
jgi:integrase